MTLELLKPPFVYGGNYKWDWDTYHIRANFDGDETAILKVMPIVNHGYYREKMGNTGWKNFIKELTQFTVQALTEKWVRDFGKKKYRCKNCHEVACMSKELHKNLVDREPLRWIARYIEDVEYLKCPECNWDDLNIDHEDIFNYCPCCGVQLSPPEKKDNA